MDIVSSSIAFKYQYIDLYELKFEMSKFFFELQQIALL